VLTVLSVHSTWFVSHQICCCGLKLLAKYLNYCTIISFLLSNVSISLCSLAYSARQDTHTFMEVVQEVLKHGSADGVRAAIRADKKSYSLVQLIAASFDVHNILCSKNVPQLLLCSAIFIFI